MSNVTYEYEVAYSVDPECSGDHVSLPDGYTLYYPRTSTHYIEVVGLMSGTCYVFGVRAYTSVTDCPGEFSLIGINTISEGYTIHVLVIIYYFNLFFNLIYHCFFYHCRNFRIFSEPTLYIFPANMDCII